MIATAPSVAGRMARCWEALTEAGAQTTGGLDALIISGAANIRWLSGFTGSNGTIVLTEEGAVLLTDGRYEIQAAKELAEADAELEVIIVQGPMNSSINRLLSGKARIGIEANHVSWQRQIDLVEALGEERVHPVGKIIEELRQVKDESELALLETAAQIADAALAKTYHLIATVSSTSQPLTERAFAKALEAAMAELGSPAESFETIVGSGPNSALPHARPTDRVIEPGDLVVLDFGARICGYGSDMTRTLLAGATKPTADQAELYAAVQAAQAAGVAQVKAGAEQLAVHTACYQVLDDAGFGEYFTHGTGHGIGLEIHESPILSRRSTGTLARGLVVTVEPGAYLPHLGGVRVEDSVVVTSDGCRPITHSPKGLVPEFG